MPAPVYVDTNTIQTPALTTPRTPISAAWGLGVRDDLEFLAKPPRCRVNRNAVQSIPHNTLTAITFTTEEYDYAAGNFGGINGGAMWALGAPSRLVAPIGGTYDVKAGAQFNIAAAGVRLLALILNGVTSFATWQGIGNGSWYTGGTLGADIKLAAGDYVELMGYQTSGAGLNIEVVYPVWASMRLTALT